MPARLPSGAAFRLLAVLCVTAGCAAAQHQQQQQPSAGSGTVIGAERFVEDILEKTVWPELRSLVRRLDESKIESLEGRPGLWMDALDSSLESKIESLENRLESIEQTVRDELKPLVSMLESKIESLEIRHKSRIDTLDSRLDTQKSQLDGLVAKVNGQQSQLESLTTRLGSQESELNRLATKLDGQQSQLTVLTETSSSEQTQIDRATNKTASQQTEIDELAVRLDHVEGETLPRDCTDLPAGAHSGIYLLKLGLHRSQPPVVTYCDMVTGGGKWTVFQRRANIEPHQDFSLGWAAYKEGFGELKGEFWWGLQHLWRMTSASDQKYELRIDMEDFDGDKGHALYGSFTISSEENGYRLNADSYTGDAGDSLSRDSVNSPFSTRDRDQDGYFGVSCAQQWKGAWWYNRCGASNLNGQYLDGPAVNKQGIWWNTWKGFQSLKKTEMKLRRV